MKYITTIKRTKANEWVWKVTQGRRRIAGGKCKTRAGAVKQCGECLSAWKAALEKFLRKYPVTD